jgi:hypothetical protein
MKRGIISIALIIFLCTFISAEIIFTEQTKDVYNLGDVVDVPVTIKTFGEISGVFQMELICGGAPINFFKYSGVKLSSGEEKKIDSSLLLVKSIIGNNKGTCKIKAKLGEEYILTENFKISELLIIDSSLSKTEFEPGEIISLKGKVKKETQEESNGFIKVELISKENITQEGTIFNGEFETNITLPSDIAAGEYLIKISAFEKDSEGTITNQNIKNYNIYIKQIPKNLELIFEKEGINPEEKLKVKAILHDQTGNSIESTVFITIKDSKEKIIEQKELETEEFLEYEIPQGEISSLWKIYAVSNKLNTEKEFQILEKENIELNIINKTIYAKNTGNVFYNKSVLIKIEDESLNLKVQLEVGESKKYLMKAPDGEYNIKIISEDGEISEVVSLTGNAIGIKELFDYKSLTIYFWVAGIFLLFLVMILCWNKVYKKKFLGKINFKGKRKKEKNIPVIGEQSKKGNKAEISLSIKGEKQDASFICLKIKNLREIGNKKGSANGTIEKIKGLGDEYKSTIYEDKDYLFFILAPAKTRTFKNEKTALEFSEKIKDILIDHNRRFNEKIKFGISLDKGTIIGKIENGIFKFMSMGPIITSARKIASISEEQILLSKKMNESLRLIAKTEKIPTNEAEVYRITHVKKENEEARNFINKFMERQKKG